MTLPPKVAAAIATVLFGFTYIVTTMMLPHHPMFIAATRALGGGIPLLLLAGKLPPRNWWGKLLVLGTLNNGLFFALLFVAAIRLPGGVAATFQALGPVFMVLLAWPLLGLIPPASGVIALVGGVVGVAMVVLKGSVTLDSVGIAAALGAAFSVAAGGTLIHKWGRPSSVIGLTAWQMILAGIELMVITVATGDVPQHLDATNVTGLVVMALLITALPFALWFWAIQKAGASAVAPMLLLTPLTAFALDAVFRGFIPSPMQSAGVLLVIGSMLYGEYVDRRAFKRARPHDHANASHRSKPGA